MNARRFPFPFKGESYRYSNDSVELEPRVVLDITPEYGEEIELKRSVLRDRHEHAYQSLPESIDGQWEIVEFIIREMATRHPRSFLVEQAGDRWTLHNLLLGETHSFVMGDASTLPLEPLDFIGRHVQEDLFYLDQRDGDLILAAGQLCFPNNWSLGFNIGTPFLEFHRPVPEFFSSGMAAKVLEFLLRLEAGMPFQRLSWTMTVGKMLPVFRESFDEWSPNKRSITDDNVGDLVFLRVEDQRLFRLPRSNGILFSLHTHLMSLRELSENPQWTRQLYHVLHDAPDYMSDYKGYRPYKDTMIAYLSIRLQYLVQHTGG